MKNSLLPLKTRQPNHLFSMYLFKYKYLFNNLSQPHLRNIIYLSSILNSNKYKTKIVSEIWTFNNTYEMQKIRNKRLQLKYINFSILFLNQKNALNKVINLFNYKSLIGFKYYLAGRANNVLWVKTRYIKNNYKKESKFSKDSHNFGKYSSDFFTTYWGSINVKMVSFSNKYM